MRVLSQEEIDSLLSKMLLNPAVLPNTSAENVNNKEDKNDTPKTANNQ